MERVENSSGHSKQLSLIIPVHLELKFLSVLLESLGGFPLEKTEFIFVVDGNNWGEYEFLQKWKDSFEFSSSVRLLHQPNQGCFSARNLGIASSTGDYLWFVDADDKVKSDELQLLPEVLRLSPDVIFAKYDVVETGRTYPRLVKLSWQALRPPTVWSKFVKRSWIIENGLYFPPHKRFDDLGFQLLMCDKQYTSAVFNSSIYEYRTSREGQDTAAMSFRDVVTIFDHHLDSAENKKLNSTFQKLLILLVQFLDSIRSAGQGKVLFTFWSNLKEVIRISALLLRSVEKWR